LDLLLLKFAIYRIEIIFIGCLIPENIGIDTKMIIIQQLYNAEIWPKVGSRMIFLGFVVTENNVLKANKMTK
jgi:hypothetical protein